MTRIVKHNVINWNAIIKNNGGRDHICPIES